MGAGVHSLRKQGVAQAVPPVCRAAIFGRSYLEHEDFDDHSFEALAIIAAGLRLLKPSYLEASVAQHDWADEHEHAWREEDFPEDSPARIVVHSAARVSDSGSRAFEGWRVALHSSVFEFADAVHGSQARPSQIEATGKEMQELLRCGGAQLLQTDSEGEPLEPHSEPTQGLCGTDIRPRMRKPALAAADFTWWTAEPDLVHFLLHGPGSMQDQSVGAYVNDHPVASPALDAGPGPSSRGGAAASKPPSPTSNKKRRTRSGASEPAAEPAAKRRSGRRSCAEGA
jgi:hypothetical protein